MNALLTDAPITESKFPTKKFCLPETGFLDQRYHRPLWAYTSVEEHLVGWCKIGAISTAGQIIGSQDHLLAGRRYSSLD